MQLRLFNVLLFVVIATVTTSLATYIYNVATSPTQEIVLVKFLLSASVIAIMTLMIDIARKWFISSKVVDGANDILLDIIGAAVVMNAKRSTQVDNDLKELEDYYEEHILGVADDAIAEELQSQIIKRVKKYKSLKFQVSHIEDSIPQVRTPNNKSQADA